LGEKGKAGVGFAISHSQVGTSSSIRIFPKAARWLEQLGKALRSNEMEIAQMKASCRPISISTTVDGVHNEHQWSWA
jgi:hypothetical protein